jgi:drug/metabolite transporter (DMT)-like permease
VLADRRVAVLGFALLVLFWGSAYVFFVPLVAVLLEALFLGETVGPLLLVGAALVVSGIYLVNRRGEEEKRAG